MANPQKVVHFLFEMWKVGRRNLSSFCLFLNYNWKFHFTIHSIWIHLYFFRNTWFIYSQFTQIQDALKMEKEIYQICSCCLTVSYICIIWSNLFLVWDQKWLWKCHIINNTHKIKYSHHKEEFELSWKQNL